MITKMESARGCGYRKVDGLYLIAEGPFDACGRMPIPLHVCPTCGAGIKPSRGWTWIDGDALTAEAKARPCPKATKDMARLCLGCPMSPEFSFGRAGLIWIGEQFYSTPYSFQKEAASMGISRRIAAVPKGFEIGKTFVFLAHRIAIMGATPNGDPCPMPAVFMVFKPKAIEVVCDGTESEDKIKEYEGRGLTPVRVVPIGIDNPLNFPTSDDDSDEIN